MLTNNGEKIIYLGISRHNKGCGIYPHCSVCLRDDRTALEAPSGLHQPPATELGMSDSENATTLPNVNGKPSRRTVLKAGAALITAGTAAVPAMAAPHPDAELIQAWSDYVAIRKALQESSTTLTDEEDEELFYRPMTVLEDKIAALPVHTHHGYAVKARMALYWSLFDWNEDPLKLATHQKGPIPDEDKLSYDSRLLWKMVEHAESMEGAA